MKKGNGIMASIAGKAVLVTGSNRGIGRGLVEEALNRGARQVYAGTRGPLAHPDERVTPLNEDIFPDPVSESIAESWRNGAVKALERELAAAVAGAPAG
jgi:NAD(P)-dependent dehydrogenase (short-subunit alcohol dehydrogenase family)